MESATIRGIPHPGRIVTPRAESPVTLLLQAAGRGESGAIDKAFPLVYDELRRLAAMVRVGRASETYDATALVHEAYLKLVRSDGVSWEGRAHFLNLAARAMRQILVDKATERSAEKRGGGQVAITLAEAMTPDRELSPEELIDLDRALDELARENPRAADVVQCRFFGAMSAAETATALDISLPTVTRDWRFARAWLTRRLSP